MTTTTLDLPRTDSSSVDVKAAVFTVASYLTDPVCKLHELSRRFSIVDVTNPTASKISNLLTKGSLLIGCLACIPFATCSLLGIALRFLAARCQREPFIHWKGDAPALQKEPENLTLLSWNICCPG